MKWPAFSGGGEEDRRDRAIRELKAQLFSANRTVASLTAENQALREGRTPSLDAPGEALVRVLAVRARLARASTALIASELRNELLIMIGQGTR
jgi:hypothetical protein